MLNDIYQKSKVVLKIFALVCILLMFHFLIQIPAVSSLPDIGIKLFGVRIVLLLTVVPITILCYKVVNLFSDRQQRLKMIKNSEVSRQDMKFICLLGFIDLASIITYVSFNGIPRNTIWQNDVMMLILTILTTVFTQPFLEELLYRGILLGSLVNYSKVLALVVSSLIFSYVHVYDYHQVFNFHLIGGLLYGIALLKTEKLYPSILLHSIHNLIVLLIVTIFG